MRNLFYCMSLAGLMVSCIQSEPLNAEADITECRILNAQGDRESNIKGNIIVENERVRAQANPKIDLTRLKLEVKLTQGATISPDPSELRDYSLPQSFEVTSQDGRWKKEYKVSVDTFEMPVRYEFEHFELNQTGKYQVFYEKVRSGDTDFKQYLWASGNSGYALTGVGTTPSEYPTVSVEDGKQGRAVKLETKSTGSFGAGVKMPIAAGNLFLGNFDVQNATAKPLKATRFGLPFGRHPERFKGWYKYQPGKEKFIAKDRDGNLVAISGQEDAGDIYAVLYESAGLENQALDGNNILTSGHIVALARVDVQKTDNFIEFDVPFIYDSRQVIDWPDFIFRDSSEDGKGDYRPFDEEKMNRYEYNLAVVFTSSKYGAYFAGSVGSTLWIDNVEVVCK